METWNTYDLWANPYDLWDFDYEVLILYIKYGYGDFKLYETSFFTSSLTDDTACLTLDEFKKRVDKYRKEKKWQREV